MWIHSTGTDWVPSMCKAHKVKCSEESGPIGHWSSFDPQIPHQWELLGLSRLSLFTALLTVQFSCPAVNTLHTLFLCLLLFNVYTEVCLSSLWWRFFSVWSWNFLSFLNFNHLTKLSKSSPLFIVFSKKSMIPCPVSFWSTWIYT